MATIEEASKLFSTMRLEKYQIGTLVKQHYEYIEQNKSAKNEKIFFEVCPKCGKVHPHIIKGGRSGSRKQMYRCKECGKRFVYDTGTFFFYSHQNRDKWARFIQMTFEKDLRKMKSNRERLYKTVFSYAREYSEIIRNGYSRKSLSF